MNATRLITPDDVPVLAHLLRTDREAHARWQPARDEAYFTVDGQRAAVRNSLDRYDQGTTVPHVILDGTGRVVGRITLNAVVRGPFQSCGVGYWVNEADGGRGLATAAVREITRVAFDELRLHRIQAETSPANVRSRRVLERCGFVRIGLAPGFIKIAGRWQDDVLYQLLSPHEV